MNQTSSLETDLTETVDLLGVLADSTRLTVLVQLAMAGRPLTVTEVAALVDHVDLSGVSRHLKALRQAGVIHADRRGRESIHRVDYEHLAGSLRGLADFLESCCETP